MKTDPWPPTLVASTAPPYPSMIDLPIARPRPLPLSRRAVSWGSRLLPVDLVEVFEQVGQVLIRNAPAVITHPNPSPFQPVVHQYARFDQHPPPISLGVLECVLHQVADRPCQVHPRGPHHRFTQLAGAQRHLAGCGQRPASVAVPQRRPLDAVIIGLGEFASSIRQELVRKTRSAGDVLEDLFQGLLSGLRGIVDHVRPGIVVFLDELEPTRHEVRWMSLEVASLSHTLGSYLQCGIECHMVNGGERVHGLQNTIDLFPGVQTVTLHHDNPDAVL